MAAKPREHGMIMNANNNPNDQVNASTQNPLHTIGQLRTINPTPGGTGPARTFDILLPETRFADRYVIKEQIGMGGMGVVYRAYDEVSEEDVALKLIHPDREISDEEMSRLKQEGVIARKLRHDNIVAVYDVGQNQGQPFFTMEYLDGLSLRKWHNGWKQGDLRVPLEMAIEITRQILKGLTVAHKKGIVHRDLKPENIIIVRSDEFDESKFEVKILDFGIAHLVEAGMATDSPVGTPLYMAPEQRTTPELVKPSADLYTVTLMLYELLVGVLPGRVWQMPSAGRPDIPRGLDQLIQRGLSDAPQIRMQTAEEFLTALEQSLAASFGHDWWSNVKKNFNALMDGSVNQNGSMRSQQNLNPQPYEPVGPVAQPTPAFVPSPSIPADQVQMASSAHVPQKPFPVTQQSNSGGKWGQKEWTIFWCVTGFVAFIGFCGLAVIVEILTTEPSYPNYYNQNDVMNEMMYDQLEEQMEYERQMNEAFNQYYQ